MQVYIIRTYEVLYRLSIGTKKVPTRTDKAIILHYFTIFGSFGVNYVGDCLEDDNICF